MAKFLPLLLVLFILLSVGCTPAVKSGPENVTLTNETGASEPPGAAEIEAASPTPPAPAVTTAENGLELLPSPDGIWTAVLHRQSGRLEFIDAQQNRQELLPAGSGASQVLWSPDSRQLAVAINPPLQDGFNGATADAPKIQRFLFDSGEAAPAAFIFEAEGEAGQIILGSWSPNTSRITYWLSPFSASAQADGVPLWVLEIEQEKSILLAEAALVNLTYQSWSLDGSALAFTNGGYRSAQVNKWLSIYEAASGEVITLAMETALVPGQIAWWPLGDILAVAAVESDQTGDEWADWMGWDNPAIQARRIYLLDLSNNQYVPLNNNDTYQDAPRWSADGRTLYYVQLEGEQAQLMVADPSTGLAQAVPGCSAARPETGGYYGQVDWSQIYDNCHMYRLLNNLPVN